MKVTVHANLKELFMQLYLPTTNPRWWQKSIARIELTFIPKCLYHSNQIQNGFFSLIMSHMPYTYVISNRFRTRQEFQEATRLSYTYVILLRFRPEKEFHQSLYQSYTYVISNRFRTVQVAILLLTESYTYVISNRFRTVVF